jgi:ABC-type Fe3+-hydroxamate transport system substrate-binding protein
MPGSHIPIMNPATIVETKPDFVFILPWNIADEIEKENAFARETGAKFVTVIPKIDIK